VPVTGINEGSCDLLGGQHSRGLNNPYLDISNIAKSIYSEKNKIAPFDASRACPVLPPPDRESWPRFPLGRACSANNLYIFYNVIDEHESREEERAGGAYCSFNPRLLVEAVCGEKLIN